MAYVCRSWLILEDFKNNCQKLILHKKWGFAVAKCPRLPIVWLILVCVFAKSFDFSFSFGQPKIIIVNIGWYDRHELIVSSFTVKQRICDTAYLCSLYRAQTFPMIKLILCIVKANSANRAFQNDISSSNNGLWPSNSLITTAMFPQSTTESEAMHKSSIIHPIKYSWLRTPTAFPKCHPLWMRAIHSLTATSLLRLSITSVFSCVSNFDSIFQQGLTRTGFLVWKCPRFRAFSVFKFKSENYGARS